MNQNQKKNQVQKRTIFIGGLAFKATDGDLREAAESVGLTVAEARVAINKDTKHSRGFGFIDLADSEPATLEQAIKLMDGLDFYGRACRAGVAAPRPESKPERRDRRGRSDGGGGGGGSGRRGGSRNRFGRCNDDNADDKFRF